MCLLCTSNAYPACASTQLIVLLEGWFSIAVTALIGGHIFFFVTRPRANVRFSDKILLSYKNGQPCLTFRCIAYGRSDLFDAKITVAVRVTSIDLQTGSSKSSRYSLALESDSVVELDQWQVWHCIDETSPFWSLTDNGRDFTNLLEKIKRHVSTWQISLEAFNEL